MTVDDESSIYVGGIPYDATEDSLRRVFDPYGDVIAVKINNDRGTRGKCYAFVTFRNPRSAVNAIDDMNGRTIGGRVVRVNEVKTRGGRLGFEREGFRRVSETSRDWDLGRDRDGGRERDYDYEKERYRDLSSDRLRDYDQYQEYVSDRGRGHGHVYDHDQTTDSFLDGDGGDLEDSDRDPSKNRSQNWERDQGLDSDRARENNRNKGYRFIKMERDQKLRKQNGSTSTNRHSKAILFDSNDDHDDQLEEQLETSSQRLEELKKEILLTEEKLEESETLVLELQQKSKKLEELLINAKKTSSHRKTQLTKLHKCFLQGRDLAVRVEVCEKELKFLVDGTMSEDI